MTEQQKITNWSYPFKPRTAPGAEPTEDVWLYQQALANALGGHYPLGTNGLWHGGVHFDQGTAGLLDQSSVYCIADGEVIAYRIDERYPVSEYESGPKPYSTGFVLVRHRLEVPQPTPANASQPTAATSSPAPSLTLFSLYMHLLDWDHYGLEGAPNPPSFISETLYTVKPAKATDPTLGLRVRATPGNGPVMALLPKGTRVEVGDAHPGSPKWRRLLNVIEGAALPSLAACGSGWVFTGEMESTPAPNVFLVGEHANDHEPNLAPNRGLNVRKTGRGTAGDPKTGLLPEGTRVSLEPGPAPYRKIKAIIEGTVLPPLADNSVRNIHGYVHFDSLQATRATPICGVVHLLDPPYPIKAGELIGHPGHYQNHNDGAPQSLLHLELFSCDDVPAFIAQSRALASALPAEQKTQLKIHKGASKLIPHREGIDASHPPSITDAGTTIGVDLIIPISTLERLPPSHKISLNTATNPGPVTHWWRLDNILADNDGNPISGWLAEQDLITTRHSPWEWEGFECVEDNACNADHLACHLDTKNLLQESEQSRLQSQITTADEGKLKTRLYEIIDGTDGSARDNKLSITEIQAALRKRSNLQAISRLICNYESEWLWCDDKWSSLDSIVGEETQANWMIEKSRIKRLSYWEEANLFKSRTTWHFHPIETIVQRIEIEAIITLAMLRAANPSGSNELHEEILPFLNKYARIYNLISSKEIAHFLSQISHESHLKTVSENLVFSPKNMRKTFGCKQHFGQITYNADTDECNFGRLREKLWTEESTYSFNAENLGNYVYANRMGNGDESSGEGYKYRGRGIIQITGKDAYENFQRIHNQNNPDDTVNFLDNPDLIISSKSYAVESAFVYWFTKKNGSGRSLSDVAKSGTVSEVTQIVNGGQNGYADRKTRFNAIARIINVPQELS
ncbi:MULTISPECIES: glycoside hydrolase family 19 protein [Pseudomonas]|uniref:glycoside hydrolase family 19 protein n=1 Tax=Pseudomonas TaxID=286 RepID=UPI00257CC28C|nr:MULTISPECIES: hypothetical protein [Pseudomonas]